MTEEIKTAETSVPPVAQTEPTTPPPATPEQEPAKDYEAEADQFMGVEELTMVYRGVKNPQNATQLNIQIAALKNLKARIDFMLSQLESEWTFALERHRYILSAKQRDAGTKLPSAE